MYETSITCIVTCHNLHDYITECIESIHAQTMRPTEIIVLHDACTPPPVFPGTITVVRDIHKGIGQTRNEGANLASSDNLLFIDADDTLDEHFIEAMVDVKSKTGADIIYPNVLLWSYWHKDIKMRNAWHESADEITWNNMLESNQIVVTSLIPRKLYFDAGGTPTMPMLEDYSLWLECLDRRAKFAKSPHSVLRYRQRANSRLRSNNEGKNEWYYKIKAKYES